MLIYDLTKLLKVNYENKSNRSFAEIAACTNVSVDRLLKMTSDCKMHRNVRDYVLNYGYPKSEGLKHYSPVIEWCVQHNVKDISGAIDETFGENCQYHLSEVIPTLERLRDSYI